MARIRDRDWMRQAFIVSQKDLDEIPQLYRSYHSAQVKFVDTTPGGNLCINPLPQATLYADPPPKGSHSLRTGSNGLGSMYSESIDDNQQIIHCRFGVPAFNSLTSWFGGFYDVNAGRLARTGRAGSAFYYLGRATSFVVSLAAWPLLAANFLYKMAKFFMNKPSSKFYYLKPTMPQYWSAVQNIVNHIAINSGLTLSNHSGVADESSGEQPQLEEDFTTNAHSNMALHRAFPDIINPKGYIDVFAIANKAQRLVNKQDEMLEKLDKSPANGNLTELRKRLKDIYTAKLTDSAGTTYQEYIDRWLKSSAGTETGEEEENVQLPTYAEDGGSGMVSFFDFLKAEWADGGAFASFRVNYTGTVSESFSNSFRNSEIQDKINEYSSESRSKMFNLAGGNVGDGVVADVAEAVISSVKDFAQGVAQSLNVQGIAVLGGAAFADIPQFWDRASMTLNTSSYTMELISPYNDPMSQLLRIYIPMAMVLAAVLPLSTGKASHTAPFICEYYDKGRCQTRLGMFKSLNVERGGLGNIGFNKNHKALSVRLTFEIQDLSTIMAMPINEGYSLAGSLRNQLANAVGDATAGVAGATAGDMARAVVEGAGVWDDDTTFSDYMNILGSTSLRNQIYRFAKLRKTLALRTYQAQQLTSKAYWAATLMDTTPGQISTAFHAGSAKL